MLCLSSLFNWIILYSDHYNMLQPFFNHRWCECHGCHGLHLWDGWLLQSDDLFWRVGQKKLHKLHASWVHRWNGNYQDAPSLLPDGFMMFHVFHDLSDMFKPTLGACSVWSFPSYLGARHIEVPRMNWPGSSPTTSARIHRQGTDGRPGWYDDPKGSRRSQLGQSVVPRSLC